MKFKEFYYRTMEDEFEYLLSYEEYLRDNYSEPSEVELDEMEEEFRNSSALKNRIIAQKPLNNYNYEPKQGA